MIWLTATVFVLWGIFAVRRQVSLYGLSWGRVPFAFLVNAMFCPICIVIAIVKNENYAREVGKSRTVMTPNDMDLIVDSVREMRPLLDGASGAYLGIYNPQAKAICDVFGWPHKKA